jgi:uncharacterized membrane protein
MHPSSMHYFPVTPWFMVLFGLVLAVLIVLIEVGVLSYAYEKLGIARRYVFLILLGSLVLSAVNIPIAELPARNIVAHKTVNFFGVIYVVPQIEHQQRTILAINVGGALIPLALSVFLLFRHNLYIEAAIAVTIVTLVTHLFARLVPGVGIAISPLVPPVVAAIAAIAVSRQRAAPVAYIAGSVGTLLGADVLNLYRLQELGAPLVSIGGAGVSDGVFLAGIIAVLLA